MIRLKSRTSILAAVALATGACGGRQPATTATCPEPVSPAGPLSPTAVAGDVDALEIATEAFVDLLSQYSEVRRLERTTLPSGERELEHDPLDALEAMRGVAETLVRFAPAAALAGADVSRLLDAMASVSRYLGALDASSEAPDGSDDEEVALLFAAPVARELATAVAMARSTTDALLAAHRSGDAAALPLVRCLGSTVELVEELDILFERIDSGSAELSARIEAIELELIERDSPELEAELEDAHRRLAELEERRDAALDLRDALAFQERETERFAEISERFPAADDEWIRSREALAAYVEACRQTAEDRAGEEASP